MLDTGADWSVITSEVAQDLALLDRGGEPMTYSTRLGKFDGRLEKFSVHLEYWNFSTPE